MGAQIPESHKDLLEKNTVATFITVSDEGNPQATVLWKKYDGKTIDFSTLASRQKAENLEANPNVSVMVIDPENPYRYIEVRGQASITREGAFDFVDELAKMYTGNDSFYGSVAPAEAKATDDRVIIKVTPDHVVTYG